MSQPQTGRVFATRDQCAEHFGVSTRTIDRFIKSGNIPTHKVGTHLVRIDLIEAEQALLGSALTEGD